MKWRVWHALLFYVCESGRKSMVTNSQFTCFQCCETVSHYGGPTLIGQYCSLYITLITLED
jgi:hypothetical protein